MEPLASPRAAVPAAQNTLNGSTTTARSSRSDRRGSLLLPENKNKRLSVSIVVPPAKENPRIQALVSSSNKDTGIKEESEKDIDDDDIDDDRSVMDCCLYGDSMTQDCIEWDESKHNVDLRKLADPTFQTPRDVNDDTPTKQRRTSSSNYSNSASSSNASSSVSNNHSSRRRRSSLKAVSLDLLSSNNNSNNNNVAATAGAARGGAIPNYNNNATSNSEQEIDQIFHQLNNSSNSNSNNSNDATTTRATATAESSSLPTPQQSNATSVRPAPVTDHEIGGSAGIFATVAGSRKRQLWEQQRHNKNHRLRKPLVAASASSATAITRNATTASTTPPAIPMNGAKDFDDILLRIQSPAVATATATTTTAEPQQSTTAPISNHPSARLPIDPLLPPKNSYLNNNQSNTTKTYNNKLNNSYSTAPKPPLQNVKSEATASFIDPSTNSHNVPGAAKPPPLGVSKVSNAPVKPIDGVANKPPPQQLPPVTVSSSTGAASEAQPRPQNKDTFDEFGDLDFSMDDLALMDSLVQQAASQNNNMMSQKETKPPHPPVKLEQQQIMNQTTIPAAPAPAPKPVLAVSSNSLPAATARDDEFDDFPIDFDALDKAVASLTQSRQQQQQPQVPPANAIVQNPRNAANDIHSSPSFVTFTRYKVMRVEEDLTTFTKTLTLAMWTPSMLEEEDLASSALHQCRGRPESDLSALTSAGVVHLRGEWYHTHIADGDVIHICSLAGQFRSDRLPLILHTCPPPGSDADDLVLIVHPGMLLTPTAISETVSCTRRAILKNRLGSTGLRAKAALFGTMRHELFEETMKEHDFTMATAVQMVKKIVKENAEGLIACNVTSREAEEEVIKVLPQLQRFANEYTEFGQAKGPRNIDQAVFLDSQGTAPQTQFIAKSAEAIEEPIISPELGLKGNVDMLVEALTRTRNANGGVQQTSVSLMGVELKTGHNQKPQNAHMAQLALYILMMQTHYGASHSSRQSLLGADERGLLLYMNNEGIHAVQIAPMLSEMKSLIGQRNVVATEQRRASRPRGIQLIYEKDDLSDEQKAKLDLLDPPPAQLPELLPNAFSCKKCFTNRECIMYAAAKRSSLKIVGEDPTHQELINQFTGHLVDEEFEYFTQWDRLVDIEADAGSSLVAKAWLVGSDEREQRTSKSVSSLLFDAAESSADAVFDESWYAIIALRRSPSSTVQTPLSNVGFPPGSLVVLSTDSTILGLSSTSTNAKRVRPQFHIVRGYVHKATETQLQIRASRDDLNRIEKLVRGASVAESPISFRLDRDDVATGLGTLRQNLVNLFTGDMRNPGETGTQVEHERLAWLRDVLIRLRKPVFDQAEVKSMFSPAFGTQIDPIPGCDLMDLAFEFTELNPDQRAAAEQVISAMDYTMIQGLPGTGKTSTIAFVARLLAALGKRVLITSYTHAAVDNVLLKLMECGVATTDETMDYPALLRVGRYSSCHPGIRPILATTVALGLDAAESPSVPIGENAMPTAESMRRSVSSARIVGVTALTVPRSPLLVGQDFDVVIVDEAGQISQPAIIGALMCAKTFVLVGDHMQLPPLVVSELAAKGDFGVSMLKRLADKHPDSVAQLTYQYRMHEEICQLSNDIVYKGKLKCANDTVAKRKLTLGKFPHGLGFGVDQNHWLYSAIDPSLPVVFLSTDRIKLSSASQVNDSVHSLERSAGRRAGGSIINDTEASLVKNTITALVACGLDPSSVGVICPFRAQLRLLEECSTLGPLVNAGLELSTIDRYQGRDKSAIVLSFVRSNEKGKVGRLLEDFRRLNVAVTRAKCKLIMIGSWSTLYTGSDVLRPVLDRLQSRGRVLELPENYRQTNA